MAKKKDTKKAVHRIVVDLKHDEHERLQKLAEIDLLPVKGEARQCLLMGLSVRSETRGEHAFEKVSREAAQAIADMPF